MTDLERVATVISREIGDLDGCCKPAPVACMVAARAAIEALMEPSARVIAAGADSARAIRSVDEKIYNFTGGTHIGVDSADLALATHRAMLRAVLEGE